MTTLYTLGHSTRSFPELLALLHENGVRRLLDVRTVPRSRYNPQFNTEALAANLAREGLGYAHRRDLGGLRKPRKDSPNLGWKNASFRGYADYMQTQDFTEALQELVTAAQQEPLAIMCAEAVPWRCHRSLIADAFCVRGVEVRHIMGPGKWQAHRLTPFAQVDGLNIVYPFALEA
jgi:uncharacterized protein (DUF488 family)